MRLFLFISLYYAFQKHLEIPYFAWEGQIGKQEIKSHLYIVYECYEKLQFFVMIIRALESKSRQFVKICNLRCREISFAISIVHVCD